MPITSGIYIEPGKCARAFSLIEMVVVLAIAATIATIALPRYSRSVDRFRAESAARRIIADLAHARSEARATGVSKTVSFTPDGDTYALIGIADLNHPGQPYTIDLATAPYRVSIESVDFDNPTDVADSTTDVVFDAYGRPDSGGQVTVQAGGESRTVVLDAEGGKGAMQ